VTHCTDDLLLLMGDATATINSTATWYVHANVYDSDNTRLTDLTGSGNHAANSGAIHALFTDTPHMYWPAVGVGTYASAPYAAKRGDIEVIARVRMADWTPAAATYLGSDSDVLVTNGECNLVINAAGTVALQRNGAANTVSTAATGFTDGEWGWIRVTDDISERDTKFYTSGQNTTDPDAVTWTQLGATVSGGAEVIGASSRIYVVAGTFLIGSHNATNYPQIDFARFVIKDAISDGTVVYDFNADDPAGVADHSSWTSSGAAGETWTMTRGSSTTVQAAIVDESKMLLDGTDDILTVTDGTWQDYTDGTWLLTFRVYDETPAAAVALLDSDDGTNGVLFELQTDGTVDVTHRKTSAITDATGALSANTRYVLVLNRDAGTDVEVFLDGVAGGSPTVDSTSGETDPGTDLTLGSDTSTFLEGEIMHALFIPDTLSDADLATLATELAV